MSFFAPDIGIDLGTGNTYIYVKKRGVETPQPSLVTIEKKGRQNVKKFGTEAKKALGRATGDITVVHPLSDSMIRDQDLTAEMLQEFVALSIGNNFLVKPRCWVTVPCRITPIEKRALRQAVYSARIRRQQVTFVEKPFAAALGADLPVFDPIGSFVVDIGAGTTEAALISSGGLVLARTVKIGGNKMNDILVSFIRKEFNVLIGESTAEGLKLDLGTAVRPENPGITHIRGRDMVTRMPRNITVSADMVYNAIRMPCEAILMAIRFILEKMPPEFAGDIIQNGIQLTGGGANLFGLDHYLSQELGLPVHIAANPHLCTITGIGKIVESPELMQRIMLSGPEYDLPD